MYNTRLQVIKVNHWSFAAESGLLKMVGNISQSFHHSVWSSPWPVQFLGIPMQVCWVVQPYKVTTVVRVSTCHLIITILLLFQLMAHAFLNKCICIFKAVL